MFGFLRQMLEQTEITFSIEDPDFAISDGLDDDRRGHASDQAQFAVEVAGAQLDDSARVAMGMNGVHVAAMDVAQAARNGTVLYHHFVAGIVLCLGKKNKPRRSIRCVTLAEIIVLGGFAEMITDTQTAGRTDRPSYRDARTHLTRPDTRHKMRLVCVLFTFENNTGPSYGRTDGHDLL